jgi:hypothetical protein
MYEFVNLSSGSYCVIAAADGFKGDTAGVQLMSADRHGAQFYLQRVQAQLSGVRVEGRGSNQTFRLPDSRFVDSLRARANIARVTRGSFPSLDVFSLSSRDVAEAITLAEPDLMRALQRTPGVGTRDDYTATMWTRGAPWDQTRIFLDGLQLYNPTHAGWLMGSINPEGVGSAYFMPGVRPAWIGEGAAGVLDLETRRGGMDDAFQAVADLSVVSARFAADGILPGENAGWMLALRRTYVDLLTSALESLGADSTRIPYNFSDVIGRVDLDLPLGVRGEASGIYEQDDLRGDFPGILRGNEANWGNRAGRVTLARGLFGAEARLTGGVTRFGTRLLELEDDEVPDEPADPEKDPTLPSLRNGLTHWTGTLEIRAPTALAPRPRWSFGVHYSVQEAEYDGPFSLTAEGIPGVDGDRVIRIPFIYQAELRTAALWGQWLFDVGSRLRFDAGARVEYGDRVANAGRYRFAPRLSTRFEVDSSTALSVGWSRSYQYAQDVGAAAGPLGPQLHLTHIWQLASVGVPAIRSEITTIGAERQVFDGFVLGVSAYSRHSTGMTVPDPTPGEIRADRPLFRVAENDAEGVEFSLRKFDTDWTGGVGYTLANSRIRAEGFQFPSPADVRHSFDFSLSRRVSDVLRISSVFSYSSGVPYTRFVIGEEALRLEEPYARRTPAYATTDLTFDYSRPWGNRTVSVYLQVHNLLNRFNPVTYSGSPEICLEGTDQSGVCAGSLVVSDRFDRGIPILPLLGVRLVF